MKKAKRQLTGYSACDIFLTDVINISQAEEPVNYFLALFMKAQNIESDDNILIPL